MDKVTNLKNEYMFTHGNQINFEVLEKRTSENFSRKVESRYHFLLKENRLCIKIVEAEYNITIFMMPVSKYKNYHDNKHDIGIMTVYTFMKTYGTILVSYINKEELQILLSMMNEFLKNENVFINYEKV